MTAHYLSNSTYPVTAGDPVVVHAAAGGVGLLLTQMVKMRGGVVVATTSTPDKADLARQAGADHLTDHEHFVAAVQEVTNGAGAAVVYDGVGRATSAAGGRPGSCFSCRPECLDASGDRSHPGGCYPHVRLAMPDRHSNGQSCCLYSEGGGGHVVATASAQQRKVPLSCHEEAAGP